MAIRLYVGSIGSGKTASIVKEMADNPQQSYITNIQTTLPNVSKLTSDMICSKTLLGTTKSGKKNYEYSLNFDVWKKLKNNVSVVLDEAHSILNSRKAMSNVNIKITEWMSMLRRVLGEKQGAGDLVLITQLPHRVDVVCRDMATNVRHFRMHYSKQCVKCGFSWRQHSDFPEDLKRCPGCNAYDLRKKDFLVEVRCFKSVLSYNQWDAFKEKTYYKIYTMKDISNYFGKYDSWQWDNLFSDLYS